MKIEIDDLTRPAIHALLNEHLQSMYELSPPESVHALDLEKLRRPEINFARSRSYDRLSLETGSAEAFKPAQRLYESFGFVYCGPFGEYRQDPNSVFMTIRV